MTTRKKTSIDVETEVLHKSARRCCICFGLNNDFSEKSGQIAHLDRSNSNSKLDNLAFLCLEHHDKYDTRTSQSKGWTIGEAKKYRSNLYLAVERWRKTSQGISDKENLIEENIAVAPNDEILILVADFYNGSKNISYDVAGSILESLNISLRQYNIEHVRIEFVGRVFRRTELELVKAVGKQYNATAFIWGHYDDGGVFPKYNIFQRDKLLIPEKLPFKLANLMSPPDDLPVYVHRHLPSQFTYLVQFTIGQIYFWKNEFKLSKSFLEEALSSAISTDEQEMKESLANIYFYIGFINVALGEEYTLIEEAFTKGIELGAYNSIVGYINRAVANMQMGNNSKALSDLSIVIELDKNCAYAYYGRGVVYIDSKNFNLALINFSQALEINPNLKEAYYNRGNSYRSLGELEKSILDYDKVIELDDSYIDSYYNRGVSYADLDNLEEALKNYNTVLQIDENYVLAYNSRGNLYKKLGDKDAASQDYLKAIDINPEYDMPHLNLGLLHVSSGEVESGIVEYNKAIQLNPKYSKAYYNRGNAYFLINQTDKALVDYSKSIDLEPEYAGAYVNRGNIFRSMGLLYEAVQDYGMAIELDADLAEAYFNRSFVYLYINQLNLAISDLLKFLELAPDASNRQDVVNQINVIVEHLHLPNNSNAADS